MPPKVRARKILDAYLDEQLANGVHSRVGTARHKKRGEVLRELGYALARKARHEG